jgi:predicted RNA-binding Zn-ribbon protein involved in translation (DUF1610 family)
MSEINKGEKWRELFLGAYYICKQCGYAFPKQDKHEAIDLDYEDSAYGLDAHCPQCGATINQLKEPTAKISAIRNDKSPQIFRKQKSRNYRAIDRMRLGNQF